MPSIWTLVWFLLHTRCRFRLLFCRICCFIDVLIFMVTRFHNQNDALWWNSTALSSYQTKELTSALLTTVSLDSTKLTVDGCYATPSRSSDGTAYPSIPLRCLSFHQTPFFFFLLFIHYAVFYYLFCLYIWSHDMVLIFIISINSVCIEAWTHYTVSVRALSSDEHHGIRTYAAVDTLEDGIL